MKTFKAVTIAAITVGLLAAPSGALAKRGDRDNDRMPDRWERQHRLKLRVNDARRDADHDGLRNVAEFRHGTDPRDRDSDDDGRRDGREIIGSVVSFENGLLTIQLAATGAGTVTGVVTDRTEIECKTQRTATASHDGDDDGDREDNSGPGSGDDDRDDDSLRREDDSDDDDGDRDDEGDRRDGDDHRGDCDDEDDCGTEALVPGALVHEAEMRLTASQNEFTEIELVKPATT